MNFHLFVLLSTIAFYILLKLYKSSITTKNKNYPHTPKKNSNLFYILFIPAILYLAKYMYWGDQFTQNSIKQITPTPFIKPELPQVQNNIVSDKLLNSPYPASTSYSSSGSY